MYKKFFDKHFGFQQISLFCNKKRFTPNQKFEGGSAFPYFLQLCLPTDEHLIYSLIFDEYYFAPEGLEIDFLKDFKKEEYDNYRNSVVTEMDKKIGLDFVIAHELSHLYSHKILNKINQNKISSIFSFKGAKKILMRRILFFF